MDYHKLGLGLQIMGIFGTGFFLGTLAVFHCIKVEYILYKRDKYSYYIRKEIDLESSDDDE